MENLYPATKLRVLLAGRAGSGSVAFTGWLEENGGFAVVGPAATIAEALALAATFRPDVVLLDFHGLAVPIRYVILLFKELAPAPSVFVLTHEANDTVRRHCRAVHADAVFYKTAELDRLAAALDALRLSPAPGTSPQPISFPL